VGLTTLPCKKKIVEKPPKNSVGFCGGGQGLSWAVEPRKEEEVHGLSLVFDIILLRVLRDTDYIAPSLSGKNNKRSDVIYHG
jgi:hypothetical protein